MRYYQSFTLHSLNLNYIYNKGDWNKTPLPAAELYILSQVVHDIDNSGELLKKVYEAIKPGKKFSTSIIGGARLIPATADKTQLTNNQFVMQVWHKIYQNTLEFKP